MHRFILLVLAISFVPSLALARTWTNREGKEIDAEFVDATDETVTLKKPDGKLVTFKLELLNDDDQRVIRGILIRRGPKKTTLTDDPASPFESSEKPVVSKNANDAKVDESADVDEDESSGLGTMRNVKETKDSKKKMKIENRQWTDSFGNSTSGKFIRFQGNTVIVLRSGRQATLNYWQLSDTDQDYLKEMCDAFGQSHLIPKLNPATQNSGPNTAVAGAQPPPVGFSAPGPMPGAAAGFAGPGPSMPMPGFNPGGPRFGDPEALARQMRELEQRSRAASSYTPPPSSVATAPSYPMPGMSSSPSPPTSYTPPSLASSAMPSSAMPSMPSSAMPSMPSPTMPSMPSMPSTPGMDFGAKQCESCGQVLGSNVTAGDKCPGCGVYFSVDRTNGKTASGGGWGGGGSGGSSRGMFRGIAVVVVLAIKAVAYMAWRSQQS